MSRGQSTSRYRSDQAKNLVCFLVGEVRYAVEIQIVREIVNPLALVALPHAPPEVLGVSDHRGDVLPVVDLRLRFGLSPSPQNRRTKWIIVGPMARRGPVALVVDAVTEVFGASEQAQRAAPDLGRGEAQRGIAQVYSHTGHLVFVVDPMLVGSAVDRVDWSALPPRLEGGS